MHRCCETACCHIGCLKVVVPGVHAHLGAMLQIVFETGLSKNRPADSWDVTPQDLYVWGNVCTKKPRIIETSSKNWPGIRQFWASLSVMRARRMPPRTASRTECSFTRIEAYCNIRAPSVYKHWCYCRKCGASSDAVTMLFQLLGNFKKAASDMFRTFPGTRRIYWEKSTVVAGSLEEP